MPQVNARRAWPTTRGTCFRLKALSAAGHTYPPNEPRPRRSRSETDRVDAGQLGGAGKLMFREVKT